MDKISRDTASKQSLDTYFTGVKCRKGHRAERFTVSTLCVECEPFRTPSTTIISQRDAKRDGLRRYFTGIPCIQGHITERYMNGDCVGCVQGRNRGRRLSVTDKLWHKDYHLRSKYGITLTEYMRLVADQEGRCLICDEIERLYVDHCHKTSLRRGLLCHRCNTLLGFAADKTNILKAAIDYLEKVNEQVS